MTAGDGHDDAGQLHDQLHPLLHHVPAVPYNLPVNIIDNIYGFPTNIEENIIDNICQAYALLHNGNTPLVNLATQLIKVDNNLQHWVDLLCAARLQLGVN